MFGLRSYRAVFAAFGIGVVIGYSAAYLALTF